jgi:hypothetical protein
MVHEVSKFFVPQQGILAGWSAIVLSLSIVQSVTSFSQVNHSAEPVAQKPKSVQESEPREIDILDFMLGGNVYQVGSAREGFRPHFLPDYGHEGIRLIDLRMLSFVEVQKELEITDKQMERLEPLFADAHEFDSVWKFELACRCAPLRSEAYGGTAELRRQINDEQAVINVLTREQAERLRQLERRFASMALAETPGDVGKQFFSYFGIDSNLGHQIKAVLREELEAIAAENKVWEDGELYRELEELFDPAHLELLREVADEGRFFSRQPLLRAAQMAPFFRHSEIEKFVKNENSSSDEELDFELIKPLILGNGRLVSFEDYYDRSRLSFGYSKWQRLVLLMKESKSEWFSLIDDQANAIGKLVVTQEPTEGAICYQFEGEQKIINHNKNAPLEIQTSAKAYREFNAASFLLQKELDDHIRRTVKQSMTPRQLDMLQFAIGATQFAQVGLFVSLSENLLGKEFALSVDQQKRLRKLIQKRREHEISRLNGVEERILHLMEGNKKELFYSKFGETTNLFPSFICYLANVLPEE